MPLDEVGNFTSAESDLIGMGGGGLLTVLAGPSGYAHVRRHRGLGKCLGLGRRSGNGRRRSRRNRRGAGVGGCRLGVVHRPLSVPPSWAGGAGVPTASTPVTLASQSWTTAAPTTGGMGPGIAGMPAVANGGRGGSSFGAPRYGVKPKVMPSIPKPTLT